MPKSRRSRKSRRSTRRVRRGGWFAAAVKAMAPPMAPPMPMPNMPVPKMPMPNMTVPKMPMPNMTAPAHKGGKRKTKRKASSWNKAVSRVYHEMKRKNSNATFGQAMKEASARKKKGTL